MVYFGMVFCEVFRLIIHLYLPTNFELFLYHAISNKIGTHIPIFWYFHVNVVVNKSCCCSIVGSYGVGFCGWTNDYNVFLIAISIQALWKTLPSSSPATYTTTCCSVLNSTNIAPFLKICHLCVLRLLGDKNLQFYCVI